MQVTAMLRSDCLKVLSHGINNAHSASARRQREPGVKDSQKSKRIHAITGCKARHPGSSRPLLAAMLDDHARDQGSSAPYLHVSILWHVPRTMLTLPPPMRITSRLQQPPVSQP